MFIGVGMDPVELNPENFLRMIAINVKPETVIDIWRYFDKEENYSNLISNLIISTENENGVTEYKNAINFTTK